MVFRKKKKEKIDEELEEAEKKLKETEERLAEVKAAAGVEKKEETEEAPEEESEKKFPVVVAELPTQPIREYIGEDKKHYEVLTIEEALAEILITIRALKEE